jgi:subtilisin family serine protease
MFACSRTRRVEILIATSKPYDSVIQRVNSVNGIVRYEYRSIDAIAATIPVTRLAAFEAMPEIVTIEKDRKIDLSKLRGELEEGGSEYTHTIDAAELSGDVVSFTESAPDGYFPIETDLMNASDFWSATGHFGEGVVVGIVDSGTADVAAISGRVLGGESFLSAVPSLEDGLSATSPLNNSHGTWVATTLGADLVFGFHSTSPLVQALDAYIPEAVMPDFFRPGVDGVPMVGPAPLAEFYALKIFNVAGRTANSIILAAFDRAIELKQLYDQGDPAGVNIRVLNGSFSGGSLNAGDDPFFAGMIDAINAAGIVTCFSASNEGPGSMTIRDPGLARNTLTVGATSIAAYEKVLRELQLGAGGGALWRANDAHQVSEFSARGPTADGRWDPDIVAPGSNIFAQRANGSPSFVSGTSFSSPNVAGAAALLISNDPSLTPDEVRAKLLNGANPALLDDNPTWEDQGFGFVDLIGALNASTANPPDVGAELEDVSLNVEALGFTIHPEDHFVHTTDWLVPGEGHEIFIEIAQPHTGLDISVSYEQENGPADQNQRAGDRGLFSVTNSWTHFGTYYAIRLVRTATAITISESDLDFGLVRINLAGDDDNAGRVRATVSVDKENDRPVASEHMFAHGEVGQSEVDVYAFEVPSGLDALTLYLSWGNGWDQWPTNDLDLILEAPNGWRNFAGATLAVPERVFLKNPSPGVWTASVQGFTVWPNEDGDVTEPYQLRSSVDLE